MSKFDDYDFNYDLDDLFTGVRDEPEEAQEDFSMDFIKEEPERGTDYGYEPRRNTAQRPRRDLHTPPRQGYSAPAQQSYRQAPRQGYSQAPRQDYRTETRPLRGEDYDLPRDTRQSRRRRAEEYEYEQYRENTGATRRSRGVGVPLIILLVVLVGGFLFAGWKLGSIMWNYHRDRTAYSDLALEAIIQPTVRPVVEAEEPEPEVKTSEVPIQVDWAFLRSQNSDVIGWLYCPNTVINYPVVRTQDQDFYLDHGFDKQPNTSGTLFADYNSVEGVLHSNFIIYGHNMKDHSMFGTLTNYTDPSYWEQNPTLYYLTPDHSYRIELICAHIVESTIDNFPTFFPSTSDYQGYLNRISYNSFWVNTAAMNTDYQLVTLSTCSYTSGYVDPRFLVHGIMMPIEE